MPHEALLQMPGPKSWCEDTTRCAGVNLSWAALS